MSHRPVAEADGSYRIGADGLAVGSTLGGTTLSAKLLANGALDAVHSIRTGADLVRGLDVHHWDASTSVRLRRTHGTFSLHPECQVHDYSLSGGVKVRKTTFVLAGDSKGACYVEFVIRNEGSREIALASVAVFRAKAASGERVGVSYDRRAHGLTVWDEGNDGDDARGVFASEAPHSWEVTGDHARIVGERWAGPFRNCIEPEGLDPLGVLHVEHKIAARDEVRWWIAVLDLPDGPDSLHAAVKRCPDARAAFETTRRYYERFLNRTIVLTPSAIADRGVYWAKANMLRVMRETPTGPGFTNDPGRSEACVGRDTAWFVHGCDWLDPDFSAAILRGFAQRQEPDGKIVEYYRLRSGEASDDGLNVNDNTPLFVLAVWHHAVTSGDRTFLEEFYEPARRAVEQLLANRDERGLVWCTASGTGANGIVGWRNVIQDYRISGATTELNSESFAALRRMSALASMLGRDADERRYRDEADALRAAIEKHLRNPENGLYYLTIDVDGRPRSEVTSDLVFPVIFGVTDEETSVRIVERLRAADFWTEAGVRTVPRDAPQYGPTHGFGLLGGVWVAVTFWYAFAASRFIPDIMAEALQTAFRHYANDPKATNTVPGQFSEWLHGETLVNQGMMLSPWFPPRYLWAAVEGACGLTPDHGGARIEPNLPPDWFWLAARNVPLHGDLVSWFVIREKDDVRLFTTRKVESRLKATVFERDVSDDISVEGDDVAGVGFARDGEVCVLVANRAPHTVTVALRREGALKGLSVRRVYESLYGGWREDLKTGDDAFATAIARGHFALVEFDAGR